MQVVAMILCRPVGAECFWGQGIRALTDPAKIFRPVGPEGAIPGCHLETTARLPKDLQGREPR